MSIKNLWEETINIIICNGKTWDDVLYIVNMSGSRYEKGFLFEIDKDEFVQIAKNTEYDAGYGGEEINMGLKIVGKNWWMERHEYDGSEWWEWKEKPHRPRKKLSEAKALLLDMQTKSLFIKY